MAVTKIEWAHLTYNPWRGCTKVSAGCKNCYADTLANRNPAALGEWGPNGTRVRGADAYLRLPLTWNNWADLGTCYACSGRGTIRKKVRGVGVSAECEVCRGEANLGGQYRPRVFCASLADVHEGASTMPAEYAAPVSRWRDELHALIAITPGLDWLLLTKRTAEARAYYTDPTLGNRIYRIVTAWLDEGSRGFLGSAYDRVERLAAEATAGDGTIEGTSWVFPLRNLWLGASFEDQDAVNKRFRDFLATPAVVHFGSFEPLVGRIDPRPLLIRNSVNGIEKRYPSHGRVPAHLQCNLASLDWAIVGGESGNGPNIRPMNPVWALMLRDAFTSMGVPFLFKQWGEYLPESQMPDQAYGINGPVEVHDDASYVRCGKKAAGRLLDGRTWDELPEAVK